MFSGQSAPRSGLERLLMVLAALCCGTGVWLVVQMIQRSESTLEVQVESMGAVDTRIEMELGRRVVPVRFSFPSTELNKMSSENFRIRFPFSQIRDALGDKLEANGLLPLSKDMVVPLNQAAMDLSRNNISVVEILVPQVSWTARLRYIPAQIRPRLQGTAKEGFTYDPSSAEIEEFGDTIAVLTEEREREYREQGLTLLVIQTLPLDVAGRSGVIREAVGVDLPEGVTLLPNDPARRTVVVEIVEQSITRVVRDVPVVYTPVTATLRAQIMPDRVDVVLQGPASAVNAIGPGDIVFSFLDVSERSGERREVALVARPKDDAIAERIPSIETLPRSVTILFTDLATPAPPEPAPSPALKVDDRPTS